MMADILRKHSHIGESRGHESGQRFDRHKPAVAVADERMQVEVAAERERLLEFALRRSSPIFETRTETRRQRRIPSDTFDGRIVAAAVVAIICSCAMFVHYLREHDDD
jgi:hypothetical protein